METIAVRRKDNGKIKIMLSEHFDPAKHERIDAPEPATADDKPKRGRKAKG